MSTRRHNILAFPNPFRDFHIFANSLLAECPVFRCCIDSSFLQQVLGLTQSLTDTSTGDVPGGKMQPERRLKTSAPSVSRPSTICANLDDP
jgi:hypothetical protein